MSHYENLDGLIIAAIKAHRNPIYAAEVNTEAEALAEATKREAFRVIDGRLQALRKAGRILWLTKAQAPGGLGGWHIAKREASK